MIIAKRSSDPIRNGAGIGAWADQPTYVPTPGDAVVRDLSMRRRRGVTTMVRIVMSALDKWEAKR